METLRQVRNESLETASVTGQKKDWQTPTLTSWQIAEETLGAGGSGPDQAGQLQGTVG